MTVNENHPKYLDFLKNEIKNLQFISNNGTVQSKFKQLATSCELAFYSYKGLNDRDLSKTEFSFSTDFAIHFEKKEQHIVIESKVATGYNGIVSYVLSMCQPKDETLQLLRKFHFDYALPIKGDKVPKPIYHLQYGGEQSPQLGRLKVSVDDLHPWLSSPRLPFVPINIALLIDIMFCEFRTEATEKITEDKKWRQHIKHNEDFLLKPYYERFKGFINTEHKYNSLIRDYNYGRE